MFNFIKMDFYRMIRSKYTWVLMILVVGLCCFSSWMMQVFAESVVEENSQAGFADGFMAGLNGEENENMEVETANDGTISIMIGPEVETAGVTDGKVMYMDTSIMADMASGLMTFLFLIFVVLFVNAEEKNGYIKNIGNIKKNWKLCVSKLVSMAIWLLAAMIIWSLGRVVFGHMMYEQELTVESLARFFPGMAVHYLLNLAMACLILMFTILTRSTALSVAVGVMVPTGFVALFYVPIDMWIQKMEGLSDFSITNYMLDTTMNGILINTPAEMLWKAVAVGVVWMVITLAVTFVVKQKRDIC